MKSFEGIGFAKEGWDLKEGYSGKDSLGMKYPNV